ncbi:hypothetical protein [Okeania sp. SIO1I7]|nr:hypothetical protein [Okeania sp. SIO1I7]NET24691.1 hypothetical protein [Okeania sp. SIO1I7]
MEKRYIYGGKNYSATLYLEFTAQIIENRRNKGLSYLAQKTKSGIV